MSDQDFDPSADYNFLLNGEESLGAHYDKEADVLYLWRGEAPREAVALETPGGHLLRLDTETYELVGVTIFDWYRKWRRHGHIQIHAPVVETEGRLRSEGRDYSVERRLVDA
jgi:Protein of unknown function (DUF2283)